MFLRPQDHKGIRVTISTRVPESLKLQLEKRAAHSGYNLSAAIAQLLELALDFEQKVEPFRPALDRLMREENISITDAVVKLLWMDVELNPECAQ